MKKNQQSAPLFIRIVTIILGVLIAGQSIFAQTETTSPERGYNPGKSFAISDIESISLFGGSLMFNLPLGSLPPGRGGIGGGINLQYDSKIWDTGNAELPGSGNEMIEVKTLGPDAKSGHSGGWRYTYKYSLQVDTRLGSDDPCSSAQNQYSVRPKIQLPDGSNHELYLANTAQYNQEGFLSIYPDGSKICSQYTTPAAITGTVTFFTADSTYLRLDVLQDGDTDWENNTWILYMPDGTRVVHRPVENSVVVADQRIIDRNGNYVDIKENLSDSNYSNHRTTYLLDQLGRKVVIEYGAAVSSTEGWTEDHIHSKGFAGADLKTKVRWAYITVNKTYQQHEERTAINIDVPILVVDKVFLPEQIAGTLKYDFDYNVNGTSAQDVGWGEVSKVTLPSGAYAEYSYANDNYTGITAESALYNRVKEKQLHYNSEYDGATSAVTDTWTYTLASNPWTVTVTAPDGSQTTEDYTPTSLAVPNTPYDVPGGEATKITNADGSKIEKVYVSNTATPVTQFVDPATLLKTNRYVKYEFTSLKDAGGNWTQTAIREYSRDKNGNVTEIKEYDFAPYSAIQRNTNGQAIGLPSNPNQYLKRITKTAYYYETPDAASTTYTDSESYHQAGAPTLLNLVASVEVQAWENNSAVPKSRTEMFYDNPSLAPTNGNPTSTKVWDSTKGAYSSPLNAGTGGNAITTSATYNAYGSPTTTTDAKGVVTTITYGCIDGNGSCSASLQNLYPTKTEVASNYSALKRTSSAVYDFYTGLTTSAKDEDNNVTNATYYDALGRPEKVASAVGTALEIWTQTVYDDQYRKVIVKSDLETKGDARKVATQFYDQLGRVRLSKTLEDSTTQSATNETDGIKVQTRYLTSGNYTYQLSSNPYRADYSNNAGAEESMGWTRSKAHKNGKHSETETFAGATLPEPFLLSGYNTNSTGKVQTDLDGDRTLFTDQAGKQRISTTNALGQLTNLWEIVPASDSATVSVTFPSQLIAYGYHTSYSYDALDNLTTVSQGSQTRSFTYSSLSRLLTATNPESGTIAYVYDNNGNLTKKTDARMIVTDYYYDALNRVTSRDYSDATHDVTYTYDNITNAKGRLTKVESSVSKTEYTEFDLLGRVKKSKQTTDLNAAEMEYVYNLSGAIVEQKYPSGRIVKNVLDNNGDLEAVRSKKNANYGFWNYAANFTYTAAGAVSSMQLGNFKWESTQFNSRLQPTQIALGTTQNAANVLDLDYTYGTTANNGNVLSQTITVPTVSSNAGFTAVQTYTYDSLNRIKDATENLTPTGGSSVQTWKQTFTYDRFGNRNFDESNTTANAISFPKSCGTTPNFTMCAADKKIFNPSINSNDDNRLDTGEGYSFDNSGNTIRDAQSRKFTYDAENKQVKAETVDSNGNPVSTIGEYFYDGDGKRVKKYVPSTGETTIFIYDASSNLVEEYSTIVETTEAKVSYLTNDHLGSPRITTDKDGETISRRDFQPFGEEVATSQRTLGLGYTEDTVRQKFTSYERDNETNIDFAEARYYSHTLGRFNSPDPLGASANINSPQTFNRYSYVINNPLNLTDPTGMKASCPEGQTCQTDDQGNEYYLDDAGKIVYTGVVASVVSVGTKTKEVVEIIEPKWYEMAWYYTKKAAGTVGRAVVGVGRAATGVVVGIILVTPTSTGCGASPGLIPDGNGWCKLNPNYVDPNKMSDESSDSDGNKDNPTDEQTPEGTKKKKDKKKKKTTKKSDKEKGNDIPSWARPFPPPQVGETPTQYAERVHRDAKRPITNRGPASDFNKLKKYAERRRN